MKTLRSIRSAAFALALLSACMAVPACTTTGTPPPVVVKATHAIDCSLAAVKGQLPTVITEVVTDLLSANYVDLLTGVGRRVGEDVLLCAIAAASGEAHGRLAMATAAEPNASTIAEHADSYLSAAAVVFTSPPAMGATVQCSPACNACAVCTAATSPTGVPSWPPVRMCLPKNPRPAGCP